MPTYDYRCSECDHRFEVVQSFHDAPIRQCPSCERPDSVRKVYGNVGVVLKGSGFYRTDNRSGSGGGSSRPGDSGSGDSGSKDAGSSSSGSGDSSSSKSSGDGSSSSSSGSSSGSKAAAAS